MCEMMENMVNKVKEQADKEKAKAVAEATKKAKIETSKQEKIDIARNLILLDKNSYQEIALVTKIDIEEVKKLAAELGK